MNVVTEYLHYFWVGARSLWEISEGWMRGVFIFCTLFSCFVFIRRGYLVWRSGGSFFSPYHIANGNFYIHSEIYFGKVIIPLKEIKRVRIAYIEALNGRRSYWVYIEDRQKEHPPIIFNARSKRFQQMKQDLKQHHIKMYGDV